MAHLVTLVVLLFLAAALARKWPGRVFPAITQVTILIFILMRWSELQVYIQLPPVSLSFFSDSPIGSTWTSLFSGHISVGMDGFSLALSVLIVVTSLFAGLRLKDAQETSAFLVREALVLSALCFFDLWTYLIFDCLLLSVDFLRGKLERRDLRWLGVRFISILFLILGMAVWLNIQSQEKLTLGMTPTELSALAGQLSSKNLLLLWSVLILLFGFLRFVPPLPKRDILTSVHDFWATLCEWVLAAVLFVRFLSMLMPPTLHPALLIAAVLLSVVWLLCTDRRGTYIRSGWMFSLLFYLCWFVGKETAAKLSFLGFVMVSTGIGVLSISSKHLFARLLRGGGWLTLAAVPGTVGYAFARLLMNGLGTPPGMAALVLTLGFFLIFIGPASEWVHSPLRDTVEPSWHEWLEGTLFVSASLLFGFYPDTVFLWLGFV